MSKDKKHPIPPSEIRNFIERFFPDRNQGVPVEWAGLLSAVADMVDDLDPTMLPTDSNMRAELIAAVNLIRFKVISWSSMGGGARNPDRLPGFKETPIGTIYRILEHCSDTVVPKDIPGLEFIDDNEYRQQLCRDLAEVESSINRGQWKAATVLGGALIEALLLEKLVSEPYTTTPHYKKKKKDPNDWNLFDCLRIATEVTDPLITKDTYTLAKLAKDYRNFIHPGKAKKEGKNCTAGFAHSVKGALIRVIENLEERYTKTP